MEGKEQAKQPSGKSAPLRASASDKQKAAEQYKAQISAYVHPDVPSKIVDSAVNAWVTNRDGTQLQEIVNVDVSKLPKLPAELKKKATHLEEHQLGHFTFKDLDDKDVKVFIVENDLALSEEDHKKYTADHMAVREKAKSVGIDPSLLLLGDTDPITHKPIRWSHDVAQNLTWWLDKNSFKGSGIDVDEVRYKFKFACNDWQNVCGVLFKQVEAKKDALFVVRYTDTTNDPNMSGTIAMAFFPNEPKSRRLVQIFTDWKTTTDDPTGILRHELGHVLGFRHEHIRLTTRLPVRNREGGLGGTIPLTEYDQFSIMHYPWLRIGFDRNAPPHPLVITELDTRGAQMYYGGPHAFFDVAK